MMNEACGEAADAKLRHNCQPASRDNNCGYTPGTCVPQRLKHGALDLPIGCIGLTNHKGGKISRLTLVLLFLCQLSFKSVIACPCRNIGFQVDIFLIVMRV